MKSFEILRKLKKDCNQENWVITLTPVKIKGRDIFLHIIYVNGSPLKKTIHEKYEDYNLGEYATFIEKYNGVSMFSGSFNVFGYNFSSTNAKFHPNDIGVENGIVKTEDRLYVASLGDYLFCLKKGEDEKIYCVKKGEWQDLFEWENFDEFFAYMYKSLLKLYDEKGNKLNPVKSVVASFVNRTTDFEEVLNAHKLVEEDEKDEVVEEISAEDEEEFIDANGNTITEEEFRFGEITDGLIDEEN